MNTIDIDIKIDSEVFCYKIPLYYTSIITIVLKYTQGPYVQSLI